MRLVRASHMNLILTLARIAVVFALTLILLELARYLGGRPLMWFVGMSLFFISAFGLFRLRK